LENMNNVLREPTCAWLPQSLQVTKSTLELANKVQSIVFDDNALYLYCHEYMT